MRNISYYMPFGDKSARKGACYAYVWPKRAPYDEMHYGRHRRYLKHVEPDYSAVNKWRRFPEGPPQRISCAKAFKLEQADAKKTGKLDAWIKCPKGEEKWEIPSNRKSWQYGGRAVVEIEND
ncbi:MAG: hypothetical protein Q7O66_16425, partial [Dehalococcoidia bacterium]|nr:hypothetical protein [Dehalococcoidia bacterium]